MCFNPFKVHKVIEELMNLEMWKQWVNYALDDNCSAKSTWALLSVWVGGLGVSCNPIIILIKEKRKKND